MTKLATTLTELREVQAEIARVDELIAQHPEYPSLLLDRDSLLKRQSGLETMFAERHGALKAGRVGRY